VCKNLPESWPQMALNLTLQNIEHIEPCFGGAIKGNTHGFIWTVCFHTWWGAGATNSDSATVQSLIILPDSI